MSNFNLNINFDKLMSSNVKIPDIGSLIKEAINDGVNELKDLIIDKLIENLGIYGLNDASIGNDINVKVTDEGISISLDNAYYMYVEYGTGIMGESFPHPKASRDGWIYDENNHGESGWWYPTIESDPNPYKWTNEFGSLYAWTRGLPSRPFMYQTWLWASQSSHNIITKHINRVLKILESEINAY